MLLLLLIVYTLERVAKLEGTLGPWLPLTALDFCLLHAKGLATFAASKRLTFQDGARGGAFRFEMGMARMCPELSWSSLRFREDHQDLVTRMGNSTIFVARCCHPMWQRCT
jgi:hypothetical protein